MKKQIKLFIFLLTLFLSFKVSAASVSITSSKSNLSPGSTFNVTVTVYDNVGVGSWHGRITYDSSKLRLISSTDVNWVGFAAQKGQTSSSRTYSFKAKETGKANVSATFYEYVDWNGKSSNLGTKTKSIWINPPYEASSNNFLKSLSVEGYNITPNFDKNNTTYTLEVPPLTETVKINASLEDSKASLTGTGDIKLIEGLNDLFITVSAENGSIRKYNLKITVKELEPINVKINNKEYSLIQKEKDLPEFKNDAFKKGKVKIKDKDIPSYTHKSITLVGLKDKDNKITLYRYQEGKYLPFLNPIFNLPNLMPTNREVKNLKKVTLKINEDTLSLYQDKSYYYFYALNLKTDKEELYRYEKSENTVQKVITEKEFPYLYIIIILSSLLLITYLTLIIKLSRRNREKERKDNTKKKEKEA